MADIDIETVVSDIKLFIEKLKTDLPEVFSKDKEENSPEEEQLAKETPSGKVLYEGQLLPCEVILEETLKEPTFSLEEGVLTIKINNSPQGFLVLYNNIIIFNTHLLRPSRNLLRQNLLSLRPGPFFHQSR